MPQAVPGAISFTRYIDIVSGVGAGANVQQRQLIARLFTDNNLLPPQSYIEFANDNDGAANVGAYFGTSSEEYKRALAQFSWISKNGTQVPKISFSRWVDTAVGGMIFGAPGTYVLGAFNAISAGSFTLTLGGFTYTLTGIDLSAASSLAGVAADIQTAVRTYSAGGTAWTGATVTYDATRACFDLVSGTTDTSPVSVAAAVSNDLAAPLGWLTGAIYCKGSAVESITNTLITAANLSNNFGSFAFIPALDLAQVTEAATWNNGNNITYQFCVPVTAANSAATSAATIALAGTDLTLSPLSGEYPEMIPMMILAATNYLNRNSVQNYMYQQNFNCTPSVTNDADANTYDALRVNYYGQTQNAGQFIQFYQRGIMTGGTNAPVDQNIYANEQWLRAAMSARIMTLLLALAQLAANATGRGQLIVVLQSIINLALNNTTISVGKPLTDIQKLFITNETGDDKAWYQVQNIGYWLDCIIESYVNDNTGLTEWRAVYTLIYSKSDQIRAVNGTHILI